MNQEPGVVSIQSQLVFGHAGNGAAVFPLEYA
jgi:pyridoxal/pyridoxine/pyridoxamine kinase